MPKIAISYRRADSEQMAGRIRDRLVARYGENSIFIDIYAIPLGSEFPQQIQKAWSEIEVLVLLMGKNWLRKGGQLTPAFALRYVALSAFLLLAAHYVIVSLDLDITYSRIFSFLIPLTFGVASYWERQINPTAAFVFGAAIGTIAVIPMTVSTSLLYSSSSSSIMPSGTVEWLENLEFVATITLGFWAGNMLARLPWFSRWIHEREDWVRVEVETALDKNVPIIPVLLDGATMPDRGQLPKSMQEISYRTATQVQSGADFDSHMTRLVAGIDKIIADRPGKRMSNGKTG